MSIGASVRRHEDPTLLRGAAGYVGDLQRRAMLHAVVVRSDVAHGRVRGIDIDEARTLDGVVAVWTAADVEADLGAVPVIRPRVSDDRSSW